MNKLLDLCKQTLVLASIVTLGLITIVGSGGGGGDGEDDAEDTLAILEEYFFRIGGPLQDENPSTINIEETDGLSLSAQPDVRGFVSCDTVTQDCAVQSVSLGSSIEIVDVSGSLPVDNVRIEVDEKWDFNTPGSDQPFSGGLTITVQPENIFVDFKNCDELPGTEIEINETDCYTWSEFEGLLDNAESTDIEILAALGWNAIVFTLEQANYSMQLFPYIDEDYLPNPGTAYYEECDAYAATWTDSPPPINPGGFFVDWLDDVANGIPGPGDSFRLEFNHCWLDEEGDNIDTYLRGSIDFVGYTEVVNQDNVITRIGFETAAEGSGKIGGVAYGDESFGQPLTISETIESGGVISIDNETSLTGRYLIVFEAR